MMLDRVIAPVRGSQQLVTLAVWRTYFALVLPPTVRMHASNFQCLIHNLEVVGALGVAPVVLRTAPMIAMRCGAMLLLVLLVRALQCARVSNEAPSQPLANPSRPQPSLDSGDTWGTLWGSTETISCVNL